MLRLLVPALAVLLVLEAFVILTLDRMRRSAGEPVTVMLLRRRLLPVTVAAVLLAAAILVGALGVLADS